ncbi:uncharacterized protein MKZ38_000031 [Zalerion maritima]|uniref:FHA domain-containing protein n=1 Tax=Zalerion maritima TaxID=339359 RepID=A0AAD5WTZ0_9PEZI|nr:uncharacterized protein MKZ38_000031 [Zalerion maritima]
MWLLEGDGRVLQGKKLWLRPGKKYLFGRTVSEPGQTAISDKTISRKHVTITVDNVSDGGALQPTTRSTLTIEDLKTKIGTTVNGVQIKGSKYVATEQENEIQMGHCSKLFRITWFSAVFTFSFTSKDLRADPVSKLQGDLEQLDIKILTEYDIHCTTHVVAKKRNTAKGLQALINGKYIITEPFICDVINAAASSEDGEASPLEMDFEGSWPNAIKYVPPSGEEPIERLATMFAPDPARENIFEGYTFVFYDQKQFDALLAAITNGKGKASVHPVTPNETEIEDFIRCVKSIAGEKGLGSFEDGSEDKGVVVVRYIPKQGDDVGWYQDFTSKIALRLDHRPIDQRDFLDAIVMKDASVLRRPLEVELDLTPAPASQPAVGRRRGARSQRPTPMDVDEPAAVAAPAPQTEPAVQTDASASAPTIRTRRARRGAGASRFKGFDEDDHVVIEETPPDSISESQGLFVSQNPEPEPQPQPEPEPAPTTTARARRSQRKRPASPSLAPETQILTQDNIMDGIAPTAAAVKRRRIKRGDPPMAPKEPTNSPQQDNTRKEKEVRVKKEIDVLEVARQNLEVAKARAAKEKQDMAQAFEGVDLAEIRKLAIVEEVAVRKPVRRALQGDDGPDTEEDGRWDARWNGRRNFKAFRKQGDENPRRQRPRTIVTVEEVRLKAFGIGDDYFLEEEEPAVSKVEQPRVTSQSSGGKSQLKAAAATQKRRGKQVVAADSDDSMLEDSAGEEGEPAPLHRTRVAKQAQKAQSQRAEASQRSQSTSQRTTLPAPASTTSATGSRRIGLGSRTRTGTKRSAPEIPSVASKRQKRVDTIPGSDGEDESGDELGFRFRR